MDLNFLKSKLSSAIEPIFQNDGNNTLASVLVIIYGKKPTIVLTEKPKHLKLHAGEISFPGGKLDKSDSDLLETALRETREEIGLSISRDQVTGQLKPVTTLNSRFTIIPFVSIIDEISQLSANAEVEKIFKVPLMPLLQTMADDPDPYHKSIMEMFTFSFEDKIIWGASARVLNQIVKCLKI